jgi:hypothetical protein
VWLGKRKASDESFAFLATQLPTKGDHIVASSTERIFPAGSLNQAIVGPFPRMIPFSLAKP